MRVRRSVKGRKEAAHRLSRLGSGGRRNLVEPACREGSLERQIILARLKDGEYVRLPRNRKVRLSPIVIGCVS